MKDYFVCAHKPHKADGSIGPYRCAINAGGVTLKLRDLDQMIDIRNSINKLLRRIANSRDAENLATNK
jgi:hypothetical protein